VVKDTGKTLHPVAFKSVNTPETVEVEESPTGLPMALGGKRKQVIVSIDDRWRIDDEWWRVEPLSRMYFAIMLASGQKLVVFKNLINNRWYRQSY
jgi:hypothetical protein